MPSISFAEREQPRMKMQEMADKNFNQDDAREFGSRSNCTPKSLKLFRANVVTCPCSMTLARPLQWKNEKHK